MISKGKKETEEISDSDAAFGNDCVDHLPDFQSL